MIRVVRALGVIIGGLVGYQIADLVRNEMLRGGGHPAPRLSALVLGITLGALIGWLVAPPVRGWFVASMAWVLHHLGGVPLRDVLAGAGGLILGLLAAFRVRLPPFGVPLTRRYHIPPS